ncbi:conserved hypothetical protein [Anaeromyxobacter dehalogenans 2CP-1]|uniref:JAB domain-containing protein n=1 Tax=Anaeromyxobacter dehalogenans (strain ATCC BAA-258 / DSM 21875 / 2CP-1) TaxID=455488 RepID=B8J680_ANAD2|nr:Mov34/MPN/PAD-1 family protein [Anaeromyxobacter dehalogenans]ACL66975.1 conserved hypothetical protein [Anaeromyxobacter dehalogenans 2CP-1]
MSVPIEYGAALLARIAALCEADPGREVCGFVVRRRGVLEVEPIPNAADRYHAVDPLGFPRSSRDSYLMDPHAHLRLLQALDAEGGEVLAVWHSHVDVGATFSAKDRADALADGVPVVPGAEYLVFGVRAGKVTEARRFRFQGGDFVESALA